MPILTQAQGARSAAVLTAGTLVSAGYIAGSVIDLGAAIPLDVTFELEFTPNALPSSTSKQCVLFLKMSLDGTNYSTGPESGTTATDDGQLFFIGSLPSSVSGQVVRKQFSIAGQPVARYLKPILKNDLGVALTSGFVYKADITGVST